MKVIGLCGRSGSGKGEACLRFAEFGIPSIDTDNVYHELTSKDSECLRALVGRFGEEILNRDGTLDRPVLRKIVFSNDAGDARGDLNRISHFYILARVREMIREYEGSGARAVLIDAPLLFESGFDKECDAVIAVIADEKNRLDRIASRDGISYEEAKRRIGSQLDDSYLIAKSDYQIFNNEGLSELRWQVAQIVNKIIND